MASIRLQPPKPFTFTKPDEWLFWKKCFEQFRVASRLNSKGDERQVRTLLYCLGEEAEDVLASTDISIEMIRNRLVVGIILPQRLQLGADLTSLKGKENS